MADQTNIEQILASNKQYAAFLSDAEKVLPLPPAKKYAIAREALRSLVISQQLLGTEDVLVVKHTDCGMTTFTNEDLAEEARKAVGDFLTFRDLTKAVEDDVAFLKEGGVVKGEGVSGWIYDVKSGKVERVV